MKVTSKKALILMCTGACIFLSSGFSYGQISAVGESNTSLVSYPVSTFQDPVFTYNAICGSPVETTGRLVADAPGNEPGCDFQWNKYNPVTHVFDIALQTDLSQSQSTLNSVSEGGYQVHITKPAVIDTFFRAWVFTHNLVVNALKNSEGKIPSNKYTCNYIDLNGSYAIDTFHFFDPITGTAAILPNKVEIQWSILNEEEQKENAFSQLSQRTYDPPVFNTLYTLHISDNLGYACIDTVRYESIQTRAEFSYEFLDKFGENEGQYRAMQSSGESAPATFRFINKSINGEEYTWVLSDTVFSYNRNDSTLVYTSDTATKPGYIYYVPYEYTATLVSHSTENCVDTFRNHVPILIIPSEMTVPNVFTPNNIFTPNGDGINDRFYIHSEDDAKSSSSSTGNANFTAKYASIKSFTITIFSKAGKKVYGYEGNIDDWEGWNGGINNNSDRPAADGVYYYIIEARGYDGVMYKGQANKFTGFLYLYRQSGGIGG